MGHNIRTGIIAKQRQIVEAGFRSHGLYTEFVIAEAGQEYPPHNHHRVHLCTIFGWAALRLDGKAWSILHPNQKVIIEAGVTHEAAVGDNGWGYVEAWDPREVDFE